MTMQAYDFLHLFDACGCTVQGGGNDQWGNITAGIDLVRKVRNAKVYGMTFPLLTTASGQKFGKSAGNAVWLDAARTSPYQFYQYWVQTDDADVERFLKLFTFLELGKIAEIMSRHTESPEQRFAQKALAEEATKLVHGPAGLDKAIRASEALFGGDLTQFTLQELAEIFADVPSSRIERQRIEEGMGVVDLLAESGLVKSKGEARRKIAQCGAYIDNHRVEDAEAKVADEHVLCGRIIILRLGKKQHRLVHLS
jgi:tyrosyl-tRNA synthetase